jgi:hypothetical protein
MKGDEIEDRLRWEIITPEAEWERITVIRQALERLASAMWPGDVAIPRTQEWVIRF